MFVHLFVLFSLHLNFFSILMESKLLFENEDYHEMPQTGLNKTFKNASGGTSGEDNSLRYLTRILKKEKLKPYWRSE